MMERAQLDTMYAVDAMPLVMELYNGPDSMRYKPWLDSLYDGWSFGGTDDISQRYDAWYDAMDGAKKDNSLLEIFLAMNDDIRKKNLRTGLILATVAAVFFLGFMARLVLLGG